MTWPGCREQGPGGGSEEHPAGERGKIAAARPRPDASVSAPAARAPSIRGHPGFGSGDGTERLVLDRAPPLGWRLPRLARNDEPAPCSVGIGGGLHSEWGRDMRMKKTSLYLTNAEIERLRRLAHLEHTSQAQIVRGYRPVRPRRPRRPKLRNAQQWRGRRTLGRRHPRGGTPRGTRFGTLIVQLPPPDSKPYPTATGGRPR